MLGINNYSFLFHNNSGNKSGNLVSTFNFSDLAAIKNGSYKKLVEAQQAKDKNSNTSQDKLSTFKNLSKVDSSVETSKKIKSSVDNLTKSVSALNNEDLWNKVNASYATDKITNAVKNFTDSYNGVMDQVNNSNSTLVKQSAKWMDSLTNTMKSSLEKIGVKMDEDNRLSVDEETLKSADMKVVKSLFSGSVSYASQTAKNANSVASASLRNTNIYTNSGNYGSINGGWFNSSI